MNDIYKSDRLFSDELDPAWWDLACCEEDQYPDGEVVFLSDEGDTDSEEMNPGLNKFDPSVPSDSSSSDTDEDANLGGVTDWPPEFCIYMFSVVKVSPQIRIVEIDENLSETPAYQYVLRKELKEEKNKLLDQLKAK